MLIDLWCVCRSVYIFERYALHMIILLLSPTAQRDVVVLLFGETSKRGAEQKLKSKHLNSGGHKAIFLYEDPDLGGKGLTLKGGAGTPKDNMVYLHEHVQIYI